MNCLCNTLNFDICIGLRREPKFTHLKNLHKAIKMCEPALVSADARVTKLGKNQEVVGLFLSTVVFFSSENLKPRQSYA